MLLRDLYVALLVLFAFGKTPKTDGLFAAYAVYGVLLMLAQSLRTTIVARLVEAPSLWTRRNALACAAGSPKSSGSKTPVRSGCVAGGSLSFPPKAAAAATAARPPSSATRMDALRDMAGGYPGRVMVPLRNALFAVGAGRSASSVDGV